MADINAVVVGGRLVRDAELKYTGGGLAICTFSIAVNRRRKNGEEWIEEASFFDSVMFGRYGEALQKSLIKGKSVVVQGELRQNRWERDGKTRSSVEIIVEQVQLSSSGDSSGRPSNASGESTNRSFDQSVDSDDSFNDDIPF